MIETLVIILACVWLLGYYTHHTKGGLLHILLVIAIIGFVIRLLLG
jgi:hypothetical protein